ncbi:hypothetical protein [Spirosoma aerophilum]
MKTDRFSDIIRRKLESIRPEFSEKDWTRMQASLQTGIPQPATPPSGNPFSGGLWTAKPWLLAAATISAIVLVSYGYWQHQEINQLRQTIGELKKHPTPQRTTEPATPLTTERETLSLAQPANIPTQPDTKQPLAEQSESATTTDIRAGKRGQRDTVFITRYVAVPTKSPGIPPEEISSAERLRTVPEQRYSNNNRVKNSTAQPDQSDNLTSNPTTNAYGEPSTPINAVHENTGNSSVVNTKSNRRSTRERRQQGDFVMETRQAKGRRDAPLNVYGKPENTAADGVANLTPSTTESTVPNKSSIATNFELIKNTPLTIPNTNWNGMLAQRARRMRPARTTVVAGAEPEKAPESQPVVRLSSRFRVGVGGEVASRLLSAGVFTELLLGKHWMVGVGISQATHTGDRFVNEFDFDERTRRNFRKEFARDIDPRRPIANIDTRTHRIQIPVALGYRISLNRSLMFVPTVGTYLNLASTENATYYCPGIIPQRVYEEITSTGRRPVDLINSLALSTGLEWQGGHWVIQGSPVLTMPVRTSLSLPDPNWQRSATVGLRARLLYQF